MGGTPCKCATKCSILGLRLWNSSLTILFHILTRNWQDLLRWPIQFPHFNHSYERARLLQQKCCIFFTCSCTETQSQEQTLHPTGDLFDLWYPLAHERQVAKAKEQVEKISNRKTGRNKQKHTFSYNCTPQLAWGVKLWYFVFFLFGRKSWFSSEKQSLCFFPFGWLLFEQKARNLCADHCKDDARTSYESSMQQCFQSPLDHSQGALFKNKDSETTCIPL